MDKDSKRALIERTTAALREKRMTPQAALPLVKELKRYHLFGYACRVLTLARAAAIADPAVRLKLAQEHAVCTYKDVDQAVFGRLDAALAILREEEILETTTSQETLGIAGSIFKQRWIAEGDKQHLERSRAMYERGHRVGPEKDEGYTGINAAFVLDLLADLESDVDPAGGAAARRARAGEIRSEIIAIVGATTSTATVDSYWKAVTIGEAYFGLREYRIAADWFQRARTLPVDGWQREATARQLARLAAIQERADIALKSTAQPAGAWVTVRDGALADGLAGGPPAGPAVGPFDVLRDFLGLPEDVIRATFLGKVGLALSGGGFRASLFHIGVLARLAEQDILRHVEVLSCVSGGSIVGAHYYLEVRRLLQSKADQDITRDDYVAVVDRVARDFLAGVQTNIRMRAVANLFANLRMIFSRTYSRTHRLGELYERQLFSRVQDGGGAADRFMDTLVVQPKDAPEGFHPCWDNWQRRTKIPQLVLNATALNTGHLWQFTATYMGEPASCINADVDGNGRLRRLYYGEAPPAFQRIRLGHAVAASACVPGLFEPLQFRGLYPGLTVSLVDGGVHDNQGLAGLLEQGCDNLIVSDASGQMDEELNPTPSFVSVLARSNGVLQARLRDSNFTNLSTRTRSSMMRGTVLHLKQQLTASPRDWVGCLDPKAGEGNADPFTSYGVRRDVQRQLAAVRTDLDSFSDAEAFALMMSGYRMMHWRLEQTPDAWPMLEHQPAEWSFQAIDEAMLRATPGDRLQRILTVASAVPLKAWKLLPPLRAASVALSVGVAAALVWLYLAYGDVTIGTLVPGRFTVGAAIVSLGTMVIGILFGGIVARLLSVRGFYSRLMLNVAIAVTGWVVAVVHLQIFDRAYLAYGRIARFREDAG